MPSFPPERRSPAACYCGCRPGPALCGGPWGPPALLASASVGAASYSTARGNPAKGEDYRDGKCQPPDNASAIGARRTDMNGMTYSGGGILSGSTSFRNSLPSACSAAQRLLGSRFSMWSKRSRADGGMLGGRNRASEKQLSGTHNDKLRMNRLTKQTPPLGVAGTASLVSWC